MKVISQRRYWPILITFIFMATAGLLHACFPSFRMSGKEIDSYFKRQNIEGTQHKYAIGGRVINYVNSGDATKPLVLFIHGSPGSLSAFIHFLGDPDLQDEALLVTTDRPGFGYSNFGLAEPSLKKQGLMLKPILDQYKDNRPIILVGHSLAGPLIAQMAVDYPDQVDGLILVAGSIDPELEPYEWFRAPLATPFLSWLVPRAMRSSNEEIYQLKPQLEEMIPSWSRITCPVVVIHGRQDDMVPFGNVDFARKMLVNAKVNYLLEDSMNHFVPWTHPHLITNAIRMMVRPDSLEIVGDIRH